jgi:hypothetical protein
MTRNRRILGKRVKQEDLRGRREEELGRDP